MKVKELIEILQKVEDQDKEVYVWEFSDIGGWSDKSTELDIQEDVVYVYDEIKWLKNVIDNLSDTGIYTTDELGYRKEVVKHLTKVLEIRVNQLREM